LRLSIRSSLHRTHLLSFFGHDESGVWQIIHQMATVRIHQLSRRGCGAKVDLVVVDPDIVEPVVHSDPEILGGVTVFAGTRVPLRNLIDYLERGHRLEEFLDDFPSVSRERAIAALEAANEALTIRAHPAR
jgi:uncharacterized protein (DUF433 family)